MIQSKVAKYWSKPVELKKGIGVRVDDMSFKARIRCLVIESWIVREVIFDKKLFYSLKIEIINTKLRVLDFNISINVRCFFFDYAWLDGANSFTEAF
jgi:hypothetical protein